MKKFNLVTLFLLLGLFAVCDNVNAYDDEDGFSMTAEKRREILKNYDYLGVLYDGMACVCMNGKWGYIDKTGNQVIPCVYDDVERFFNGFACVRSNGKFGYVDKVGNLVPSDLANIQL